MRLVDVSSYQGDVDWKAVAGAGYHAAFVKATEGRHTNDPRWSRNRAAARAAGVHVGAYHFAHPELNNPVDEAMHLVEAVHSLKIGELKPVLDYEVSARMTSGQQARWIRSFNHTIREKLGVWPIFYSYPALVESFHFTRPVGNGLWLASYGPNDGREHSVIVPTPWHRLVAHQFTSVGNVPGIHGHVDVSSARSLTPLLAHPVRGTVAHAAVHKSKRA